MSWKVVSYHSAVSIFLAPEALVIVQQEFLLTKGTSRLTHAVE
jgi:hypothetical protein